MRSFLLAALTVAVLAASSLAEERVFLASGANVSPDGSTIVTSWLGDLYRVGSEGGRMTRLTSHPATDSQPFFSPDGSEIAFVSDRDGGDRVYVMPASGGPIEAITHDTNGAALMGWFPDGEHLLVRMRTDRAPRYAYRFFRVSRTRRVAPKMLFDAWGYEARLSPDGRKVLFTREGKAWWNKGYRGPQAGQIWSYDLDSGEYRKLLHETYGFRSPRWTPDGKAFVCLADVGGCFNLMKVDIASGARTQLTRFDDDNIVTPSLSANGDTIVFRHRFDLYRFRPDHDSLPKKLELTVLRDPPSRPIVRKNLSRADDVAFSADGLEIAFLAGGDLFVMDTVLREPKRITKTSVDESWPVFLPDGKGLLFIRPKDGQGDIWRVERKDEKAYWWQTDEFVETCLSDDPATERLLSISPTGTHIAFVRGRGRLIVRDLESGEERTMVTSFRAPSYDWSPVAS